jgi:hypothetical protein
MTMPSFGAAIKPWNTPATLLLAEAKLAKPRMGASA